jgi:hypothetical protein
VITFKILPFDPIDMHVGMSSWNQHIFTEKTKQKIYLALILEVVDIIYNTRNIMRNVKAFLTKENR